MRDFANFQVVLATFVEWAKTTDLAELTFMLPKDEGFMALFREYLTEATITPAGKKVTDLNVQQDSA